MKLFQLKSPLQKRYKTLLPIVATAMSFMAVVSFYPKTAISAPIIALKGTWGTVLGYQANVRIRPSSSSPNVATVTSGTKVMAWGTYNGWYRVETTDHHFGWVHHNDLAVSETSKLKELSHAKAEAACDGSDNTQVLYGSPLQLRLYYAKYKAPGALLGLQKMGEPLVASSQAKQQKIDPTVVANSSASPSGVSLDYILTALRDNNGSAAIDINNNYNVQSLDPVKKSGVQADSRGGSPRDVIDWAGASNRLAFGESVAGKALSYRGMPYIYGAESPLRGFDCSGLVSYVLHLKGLHPPRTAAEQAHYGTPVSRDRLKAGDLVFFANTDKRGVSHVGIYIGNNNFVAAANPRKGVRVDSLSSPYYANHYYGARRPPAR